MSKRPAKIEVTVEVETRAGHRQVYTTKMSAYHFAKIDDIMKNAAKRFKVYTLTAPDGTVIAKLV